MLRPPSMLGKQTPYGHHSVSHLTHEHTSLRGVKQAGTTHVAENSNHCATDQPTKTSRKSISSPARRVAEPETQRRLARAERVEALQVPPLPELSECPQFRCPSTLSQNWSQPSN